jgi:BolA protein
MSVNNSWFFNNLLTGSNMKQRIEKILQENLQLSFLEVKNNSHLHAGHLGDNGTNETHFAITIEAEELRNLNAVNAHRKINKLLEEEFKKGLHALEIKVK